MDTRYLYILKSGISEYVIPTEGEKTVETTKKGTFDNNGVE
jgi:hypothetical protein